MSESITVWPVGTEVTIGDDITGKVIGIWICGGRRILYQVAWWSGRSREEKWLEEFEVKVAKRMATKEVGFHTRVRPEIEWLPTA